jgi:hypothetical protein
MPTLLPVQPLALILVQSEPDQTAAAGQPESPGAAQQTASWVLVAFGVVILTWVMLRLQWKRQRRAAEDGPVEQMRETLADRQTDMERAAEVSGIVRDLAARLETRAARLEALLDRADERIEQLETRLAASGATQTLDAARPGAHHAHAHPHADTDAHPHAHPPADTDPWARSRPNGAQGPRADHDPLHQDVYDLADDGHTPLAIARRLDQQVGTIELILALRR